MNILHVVNVFFVVPYFFGDQFKYLRKKGYNIFVICSPSPDLKNQSLLQEFKYKEIPVLKKVSLLQDVKSIYFIYKYIKQNKIDVVNGHTPKGALLSMLASYIARTPKRIYFRHGLVFETATGIKRSILIAMDRLTAFLATQVINVSPSVAQKSLEYRLNPVAKQTILSKGTCSGIDLNKFNPASISLEHIDKLRSTLNISKQAFVIGFTGRLVRDKGILELVNAYKELRKQYENLYLLLVGISENRDALPHDIMEEIKDNPYIVNTGYIHNDDIQNYYALMNVYILPSYREGFPTSVLEASAMKLPIVTTRVTGCIDAIIENKTGVFVGHTPDSIYEGIEYFIKNPDLACQFGVAGRDFVAQNFEQQFVWAEIEKLYCS